VYSARRNPAGETEKPIVGFSIFFIAANGLRFQAASRRPSMTVGPLAAAPRKPA